MMKNSKREFPRNIDASIIRNFRKSTTHRNFRHRDGVLDHEAEEAGDFGQQLPVGMGGGAVEGIQDRHGW